MVFITTRHATSLRSSNNCKCLIETFFIARGESPLHKRLNPCGAFGRVPLLEYGGLKPILPFLEGRSDAACRVVIKPRGSWVAWYTYIAVGGGIFAKTAKTPPLQSALRGDHWEDYRTDHHLRPADIYGNCVGE